MNLKERINALLEKHGLKLAAVKLMAQGELEDGTKVASPADSFEEGAELFVVTDEGEVLAPDGDHKLADGTVIKTEAGIIVSVTAPQAAAAEPEALSKETVSAMIDELNAVFAAEIAVLNEKIAELTGQTTGLEAEKASLSELVKTLSAKTPESVTRKKKEDVKSSLEITPNMTTKERVAIFNKRNRK